MQGLRGMVRLGERAPSLSTVFGGASLLVAVVCTARLIAFTYRNSCFVGDDLTSFWLAGRLPFFDFSLLPIDVHFAPLHRATNWVMARVANLDFSVALAVSLAVHLATIALLVSIARRLRAGAVGCLLVAAYAVHLSLGSMFMWWSSGLHRLPYVFFAVLSCWAYLRYRETGSWRDASLVCVSMLAGLGFYSKAVLIPLYVGALHVAVRGVEPMRIRRSGVVSLALALSALALAYVIVWKWRTNAPMQTINEDARFYEAFLRDGFQVFAATWLGLFLDDRPWVEPLAITVALVFAGVSIALNRRAALAWIGLAVALAANFLLHAASAAKTLTYGLGVLASDRYYFESTFLVVVFVSAAYRGFARVELPSALARWRWVTAALGVCLLGAFAVRSFRTFQVVAGHTYASHRFGHDYMANLRASLAAFPPEERRDVTLKDGPMPAALVPFGAVMRRQSDLLRLMGIRVRYAKNAPFYIAPDGEVVRSTGAAWIKPPPFVAPTPKDAAR
ncbi:MAG TPA: glycosyltransferase family 39 protein [Polyangiaceae bacterium]|nr:glycosyltransferase family 39 protein [Polyangiaceae bacterium]